MMRPIIMFLVFEAVSANASMVYASDTSVPHSISRYLEQRGPVTVHKTFFSSTRNYLIEYFCVDDNLSREPSTETDNPANVSCGVALFNKKGRKWIPGDAKNLGQGSVKEFGDGKLVAETVEYRDDDASCCPSLVARKVYYIRDGKFIDARP
jgi:hypothetical protein